MLDETSSEVCTQSMETSTTDSQLAVCPGGVDTTHNAKAWSLVTYWVDVTMHFS